MSVKDGKVIAVGTTKTSVVKFWVGTGALKKKEDSYQESILSPSQLEKTTYVFESIFIDGLSSKNFKKIRIVN